MEKSNQRVQINLRLSPVEKVRLELNAKEKGFNNISEYIKMRCIYATAPRINLKELTKLNLQISKIGNNINQITKNINLRKFVSKEELKEIAILQTNIINSLNDIRDELKEFEKTYEENTSDIITFLINKREKK